MKIFLIWFLQAIRLVKSGLQFVFKILYIIRYQINPVRLIYYFPYQIYLIDKSHENDVQNTEAH